MSRIKTATKLLGIVLSVAMLSGCPLDDVTKYHPQDKGWQLVWSDEFDQEGIDPAKWGFEQNCWGGGNNEQQCYTNQDTNAYIENGALNIVAIREDFTGPAETEDSDAYDPEVTKTLPYTSARLRTKEKGDWKYGRIEVRAQLPYGQGTWPAIWMLPTDWVYGGWAGSGEIDIMEAVNLKALSDDPDATEGELERRVHGTLHYGRAWPQNVYSGTEYYLPEGLNPADGFHVYSIEWQEGEIRWFVDDVHFATQRAEGWYTQYMNDEGELVNGEGTAPFDQQFHLILNLAVGGAWAGNVNESGIDESVFPQKLVVDYVRVYECEVDGATGAGCETVSDAAELVEGHEPPEIVDSSAEFGAGPVFTLYDDQIAAELSIGSYNPDSAITITEPEEVDRGTVLQVVKAGAVGNVFFNRATAVDLSHWQQNGQLVFDLKVSSIAEGTEIKVKLDSGWPNVSPTTVATPTLDTWTEVRLNIADILANSNDVEAGTADIANISNPFVIESSGEITFQLDNIRYEYDFSNELMIFADDAHPAFPVGQFVASGSVDTQLVDSGDEAYGQVQEFTFNTNESVVFFQGQLNPQNDNSPQQYDLGHFDRVAFDLKVIEDPREEKTFVAKVDCGYPCGSGDVQIAEPGVGTWTSYDLPLSTFVSNTNSSLDLTVVDTPLVIFPSWGNQQGVKMQIDNVRWLMSP